MDRRCRPGGGPSPWSLIKPLWEVDARSGDVVHVRAVEGECRRTRPCVRVDPAGGRVELLARPVERPEGDQVRVSHRFAELSEIASYRRGTGDSTRSGPRPRSARHISRHITAVGAEGYHRGVETAEVRLSL